MANQRTAFRSPALAAGNNRNRAAGSAARKRPANKLGWQFLLILLSLIAGASLAGRLEAQQTSPNADEQFRIEVMAVVNGTQISRDELAQECMARFGEDVLESLVHRQLIIDEANRRGVSISSEEVAEEMDRLAAQFNLPLDQWIQMLQQRRNISREKYEEYVWTTMTLQKLAENDTHVSAQEVDELLESEIGPKVQARLISTNSLDEANQIRGLLDQDPESFGKLARKYSSDPNSAANSGMIPPIRRYVGPEVVQQVAFNLNEGQISDVIEVEGQYVILKCEAHLPAMPITPQQEQIARQRIVDHLTEKKLAIAADTLFNQLEQTVEVINIYNDPQLGTRMPNVAAIVGNSQITFAKLSEECITRHGGDVLDGEINRVLLLQELRRNSIELRQDDIQAEIARAADAFAMLDEQGRPDIEKWLEYVTSEDGVTVDLYVRDVAWPSAALKRLVENEVMVTDEDMQKAFDANFGERVKALAIVLQDQRSATKVWNLARQNPTQQFFGELANQYSTEPASQANFGQVPPIQRYGGRKALEDEAFRLEPGEISGLVEVGDHWIILMCLGRTEPEHVEPNDPTVREELYKDIYEKKLRLAMAKRLEKIRTTASIDNFLMGTTQSPARSASLPMNQLDSNGRVPFRSRGDGARE